MIRQVAGRLLDRHVMDAGLGHDRLGRLAAGEPAARRDAGILVVGARDPDLHVQGEGENQDEEQEEIVEPLGLPETLPPPTFQARSMGK